MVNFLLKVVLRADDLSGPVMGGDHSAGPRQRTGIVAEGGPAHPDDTLGGVLQPGWRTGSPCLLDRCDEEAWREEQSSPTFDFQ